MRGPILNRLASDVVPLLVGGPKGAACVGHNGRSLAIGAPFHNRPPEAGGQALVLQTRPSCGIVRWRRGYPAGYMLRRRHASTSKGGGCPRAWVFAVSLPHSDPVSAWSVRFLTSGSGRRLVWSSDPCLRRLNSAPAQRTCLRS